MPVYEPKARLIESHNLQRFLLVRGFTRGRPRRLGFALPADPPQFAQELFLKVSCSFGSAFSWRGRPVLSFTLRLLNKPPTLSGWA
jgi:hypothetical protein